MRCAPDEASWTCCLRGSPGGLDTGAVVFSRGLNRRLPGWRAAAAFGGASRPGSRGLDRGGTTRRAGQVNEASSGSGMRCGRPEARPIIAQVVAARATTVPSRTSSVLRMHDAARQLSTQVSARSA